MGTRKRLRTTFDAPPMPQAPAGSSMRYRRFNTRLTERGSNLSGGQRQRIALARALITAPELLILDDTTSAVDAGTEAEINTALGRYADNEHMLLVIARRRSTLQLADRIVVLDKGRVVDIGTGRSWMQGVRRFAR